MKRLMRLVLVTLPVRRAHGQSPILRSPTRISSRRWETSRRVGHFDPTRQTWNDVVAAKDEASWIKHANAIGDNETLAALDAEGSTTKVRAGTRVKFVSHKDLVTSKTPRTAARVRLDEGPNKDRLVWVERRFVSSGQCLPDRPRDRGPKSRDPAEVGPEPGKARQES